MEEYDPDMPDDDDIPDFNTPGVVAILLTVVLFVFVMVLLANPVFTPVIPTKTLISPGM